MKKIISLYILSLILFSCAEQVPPSGGDKDTTAPKAKSFIPENYSTNFHYSRIEIKFDEFIKLNTSGSNIIISPSIKKPKIELLGKKVRITFQEMLENNTTYIINFGNSIKDYNEGNQLNNFKYIFSTGAFLDSLKITGQVLDAFNNKPLKNIIVALYPENEDSILYKKPLYFIKTDKEGNYSIENIKQGKYKLAALEDKNLNFIFDQESEKIAFSNELIILDKNTVNKTLYLFENKEKTILQSYDNIEPNHILFHFNKAFLNLSLDISNYNKNDIVYYSLDKKDLHYWYLNKDSFKSQFYFNINNKTKDTVSIVLKDNNLKEFNYIIDSKLYKEHNILFYRFPFPINQFNSNLLSIKNNNSDVNYSYEWKENNQLLELSTYKLYDTLLVYASENCFYSFNNLKSRMHNDTLFSFLEDISNLELKINSDKKLITELYNKEGELIQVENVSRETNVLFSRLKEGKYFVRVYEDKNNDNIWNTGIYSSRQQAEKTFLYKEVNIKSNFDQEITFDF